MSKLKAEFLEFVIGYVLAEDESPDEVFDRLRVEDPDLFPVPRYYESFWEACQACINQCKQSPCERNGGCSGCNWGAADH